MLIFFFFMITCSIHIRPSIKISKFVKDVEVALIRA